MKTEIHKNEYFADWMAGSLSDEALQKIISEEEYKQFLKLKKGLDAFAYLETPMDATFEQIKQQTIAKKPQVKKENVRQLFVKWTASVAAVLAIVFGLYQYNATKDVLFQTGFGEQQTIALLDGSQVILNAGSTLKYNKKTWKESRELSLDGEAYFKVSKGKTFKVHTPNGDVTVLGTQFNVSSESEYFDVVCYEGRVQVNTSNFMDILTPGKSVTFINGKNKAKEVLDTAPSWVTGITSFDSAPLSVVLKALEKQFDIQFDSSAIDTKALYTGAFDNKKLNLALAAVFKPMHIKYIKKENSYILQP